VVLLDGMVPSDNWDSGIVSSEIGPDPIYQAAYDLRYTNPGFQNIE
jgi:hypothetical protein